MFLSEENLSTLPDGTKCWLQFGASRVGPPSRIIYWSNCLFNDDDPTRKKMKVVFKNGVTSPNGTTYQKFYPDLTRLPPGLAEETLAKWIDVPMRSNYVTKFLQPAKPIVNTVIYASTSVRTGLPPKFTVMAKERDFSTPAQKHAQYLADQQSIGLHRCIGFHNPRETTDWLANPTEARLAKRDGYAVRRNARSDSPTITIEDSSSNSSGEDRREVYDDLLIAGPSSTVFQRRADDDQPIAGPSKLGDQRGEYDDQPIAGPSSTDQKPEPPVGRKRPLEEIPVQQQEKLHSVFGRVSQAPVIPKKGKPDFVNVGTTDQQRDFVFPNWTDYGPLAPVAARMSFKSNNLYIRITPEKLSEYYVAVEDVGLARKIRCITISDGRNYMIFAHIFSITRRFRALWKKLTESYKRDQWIQMEPGSSVFIRRDKIPDHMHENLMKNLIIGTPPRRNL